MKTKILCSAVLSTLLSISTTHAADQTIGQKAGAALETAKDKTVEAGQAAIDATKNTATAIADSVMPDADARRISVKLTSSRIEMPEHVQRGKTAFVVTNGDSEKRNFEITGHGIDRKFIGAVEPNGTKTIQMHLKPGNYRVISPVNERTGEETHAKLWVK